MFSITVRYRHQNRVSSQQIFICVHDKGIPGAVSTPLHIL